MAETITKHDTIINVEQLKKSFDTKPVLQGVDLSIPRGAVVGLMGTNGAGKSTLIKSILGLIKFDSGNAKLFGCESEMLTPAIKERLGYVPQIVNLYTWMKVRHVISYTASFYSHWNHDFVADLAKRWHVPLDDRVQGLSSGQLQTLALVLALGHLPELLILDEPVASLDPIARRDFLRELLELTVDGNRTVLFSTHISSDLERVATHVAILSAGRITQFCELDELKDKVKRLRLRSTESFPLDFSVPGALRTKVDGPNALTAVADVSDEFVEFLQKKWNADVQVENLNLEEIFVELNERE
jgi:ABC-2 type transport system ATP-binding protein